jgi:hypothetical protein
MLLQAGGAYENRSSDVCLHARAKEFMLAFNPGTDPFMPALNTILLDGLNNGALASLLKFEEGVTNLPASPDWHNNVAIFQEIWPLSLVWLLFGDRQQSQEEVTIRLHDVLVTKNGIADIASGLMHIPKVHSTILEHQAWL